MPQVGSQNRQEPPDIVTRAVPLQQALHRASVAEVMQAWTVTVTYTAQSRLM
jgi:hypothetical protein